MNAEYIRLCSIPAVQEKIREGMGRINKEDLQWCKIRGGFLTDDPCYRNKDCSENEVDCVDHLVILPQVHDLNDEKRGLWGMVDWDKFSFLIGRDGELMIFGMRDRGNQDFNTDWQSPELALLRALMHQWGIEEELADYKAANASIREELRCRIKERDKLEAENQRLREAIKNITDDRSVCDYCDACQEREALKEASHNDG